jgi:predicted enzyme related to lactoylglutathione lyase
MKLHSSLGTSVSTLVFLAFYASIAGCRGNSPDLSVTPKKEIAVATTQPVTRPTLKQALPELPLADVVAGVTYYRDVLGFSVNFQNETIGVMDRDRVRVLLVAKTERHKGIGSCYVYVADVDGLHAEFTSKGAKVEAPPVDLPHGLREFRVFDPEGNIITFGQPFE